MSFSFFILQGLIAERLPQVSEETLGLGLLSDAEMQCKCIGTQDRVNHKYVLGTEVECYESEMYPSDSREHLVSS